MEDSALVLIDAANALIDRYFIGEHSLVVT